MEMSAQIITILFLVLVYIIYKYVTKNYDYWSIKNVSFSKPSFPFGNFQEVFLGRKSVGVFLEKLYNSHKTDTAGFWIFGKPYLLIRSPEVIKNILVKDFNHFYNRSIYVDHSIDPIGTKTLFIVPNPEWKATRIKVTPFFTTSKMKNMLKLIEASCAEMVQFLKARDHQPVDAKDICARYTTDVISNCAFGVNSYCFENDRAPFRLIGKRMFGVTFANGFRFISYFLMPVFVKIFRFPIYDKTCTDFLKEVFLRAIEEREDVNNKRNDLIDIIIQMKNEGEHLGGFKFEGDTVVAQALQFYIAGFETTSSTLSMVLYQLCLNPEIQEELREELLREKENSGNLSYEAVMQMDYMGKVISETLRMFPPLPFLDRRCVQNYKIPGTDVTIEKGTPVFLSMLGLHYDPEYFPNPEVFDPERFSEENIKSRPTYAYIPFGHGPRNCIGERFGLMTSKMCLANILLNFKILKTPKTPEKLIFNPYTILLQPIYDLPIQFKPLV